MITTDCERCCFLDRRGCAKKCVLKQVFALKNEQAFAPGYCRLCRSSKWAKKQNTTELSELQREVLEECGLKFDLLIFFDESLNSIEDLDHTLDPNWYFHYANKIIIVDVTGFGSHRENLALQYINKRQSTLTLSNLVCEDAGSIPNTPIVANSSSSHEPIQDGEKTIKRISKLITSPFFLAIPAGSTISPEKFRQFASMVRRVPSRVIHWSFPYKMGSTIFTPYNLTYGLFITKPYLHLTESDKSFTERLRDEEAETEIGLSWFSTDILL
ncbi:hypothetical protein LCGC14_0141720 [marine sediment metagenome]|uniref:Uncharacterized protein n=1 Tax=marine sediment metagenome TaxID=412755 RepID=A0A0F9VGH2_9ZZZZ